MIKSLAERANRALARSSSQLAVAASADKEAVLAEMELMRWLQEACMLAHQ